MSTKTEIALLALISELNKKIESLTQSKAKAVSNVTTEAAITELIAAKTRANQRAVSLKSLRYCLLRFAVKNPQLAKYQDAGKVAFKMGNSPQVLMTHYSEPVTQADCEAFWTLQSKEAK